MSQATHAIVMSDPEGVGCSSCIGRRRWKDRCSGSSSARISARRSAERWILRRFDAELQPSGYLVGSVFGVADLTLASLLSTFIYPSEFPYPLVVPFPEPVAEYRTSLEQYEALAWAREIYASHRSASAEADASA